MPVRYIEQLIGADGMCQTRRLTAQIIWEVVALERQEAVLKVNVDKDSGQQARKQEGSKRVYVAVRRPHNGFFPSPLLNSGHGHFSLFRVRLARSSCACVAFVVWTWRNKLASCSWVSFSPRKSGSSVFIRSIWIPTSSVKMCISIFPRSLATTPRSNRSRAHSLG